MHYFGYCTWLDVPELHKYFPEAKPVTRAVAKNHRVEFRAAGTRTDRGWCHLSNAQNAYGSTTQGFVYEVDDKHLDENFDDFDIVFLTVAAEDGTTYDCFTYILSDPGIAMRPPKYYWNHVPNGLRARKFPDHYVAAIERTYEEAEACPDADRPVPSATPGASAGTR